MTTRPGDSLSVTNDGDSEHSEGDILPCLVHSGCQMSDQTKAVLLVLSDIKLLCFCDFYSWSDLLIILKAEAMLRNLLILAGLALHSPSLQLLLLLVSRLTGSLRLG